MKLKKIKELVKKEIHNSKTEGFLCVELSKIGFSHEDGDKFAYCRTKGERAINDISELIYYNDKIIPNTDKTDKAKKCDNCLQWLKHCNAECCKIIYLTDVMKNLQVVGDSVVLHLKEELSPSDQLYYALRDVEYSRKRLKFKKDKLRPLKDGLIYYNPCSKLVNNKCSIHDTKPEICRSLTLESVNDPKIKFKVTDNCLFKFKKSEKGLCTLR